MEFISHFRNGEYRVNPSTGSATHTPGWLTSPEDVHGCFYVSNHNDRNKNLSILKTLKKLRLKAGLPASTVQCWKEIVQQNQNWFDLYHPAQPGKTRGWEKFSLYWVRKNDKSFVGESSWYGGFIKGRLFKVGDNLCIESSTTERWSCIKEYPRYKGSVSETTGVKDWEKEGFTITKTFIDIKYQDSLPTMRLYKFVKDSND